MIHLEIDPQFNDAKTYLTPYDKSWQTYAMNRKEKKLLFSKKKKKKVVHKNLEGAPSDPNYMVPLQQHGQNLRINLLAPNLGWM